jgi:ribosomal protein S12 methylthiotransferase
MTRTRIGFISLGCPKNLVDSEVMMGILARSGAELVADAAEADVVVVNTCGFIDAAKEESVQTILEAAELKTSGRCRRLVVAGCLVQRAHEELRREIPEIDAFAGLDDIPGILGIAAPELAGGADCAVAALPGASRSPLLQLAPAPPAAPIEGRSLWLYDDDSPRVLSGPAHSAYLKIAEGCDNPCSFCAIPAFRGAFRSRRLGSILREAQGLAAQGVRELNLIAQDSTHYGHDLGLADGPARLLRGLNEIEELRWIRLFYVYPNRVTDSLLDAMAGCERVVKYLDMPLQSASRAVLARMKRGGSGESHLRLIERMRERVPGLVLRSTFIAGFPGETEAEFRETLEFLEAGAFDHAGVFTYSHEEQTPAFALDDDVPHEVKAARREQLLAAQEKIARAKNRARVGTTIEVLCEGAHPESDDLLVGRHAGQAPEIDGSVILNEGDAAPGEFVRAKVLRAHPFDLVARILGPAEAPRSMAPGTR